MMNALERFMSHTQRDPETGCLLWIGGGAPRYGVFWVNGKSVLAHRWIFREKFGYLPEVVMHRCDTPACVDWERCLMPGTQAKNIKDRDNKGHTRKGDTHGRTLVTDAQCREIRAAVASGEYQYVVGERYGISKSQVSNIVRGVR